MKQLKLIFMKLLPWIVIGLIGVFFYRALATNWENVKDISLVVNGWTIAGVATFVLAVVASGVIWGRMLTTLSGQEISSSDAVRVQCASWLLKYVPGQVGSYINKLAWGSKQGISKKTVSTSFIYENTLMVFAGFILSIPVIWLFRDQLGEGLTLWLPLLVLIPLLVILYKPIFYWLLNKLFKLIKKEPFRETDFLSSRSIVSYQLGYMIPRLLNGVGFVFVTISLLPVDPSMYIGLGAAYTLASIIGLLAIFVPSGLGVREAVIALLLSAYFPVEQAIVLAIVARLYATIADIGVALVYLVLNKGRIRQL